MEATCWRLLIALQLQKNTVGLYKNITEKASPDLSISTLVARTIGNTSGVQAGERITPDIDDLDAPLIMGNRLREPIIKAIQEAAKVSWDRKVNGLVEDEDVPLPSKELKRWESLFFNRHKLRIPAGGDTGETVVNHLKRQPSKHCIGFENIMKTETRKTEPQGPESSAWNLVVKPRW